MIVQISRLRLEVEVDKFASVQAFVQSCTESTLNNVVQLVGIQGGYYTVAENYFATLYNDVPYYYSYGEANVPSKERMEEEIKMGVSETLPSCIQSFREFSSLEIRDAMMMPEVAISNDQVILTLNYPYTLQTPTMNKTAQALKVERNVRLLPILEASTQIVNEIEKDSRYIPTTVILDLIKQENLQIDTRTFNQSVLYIIRDFEKKIEKDTPFVFLFAIYTTPLQNQPYLDLKPVVAEIGKEVAIDIDAENEHGNEFYFSSDSTLFSISPSTGQFRFTPMQERILQIPISLHSANNTLLDRAELTIMVVGDKHKPQLFSSPRQIAQVGSEFVYQVTYYVPEGQTISFVGGTQEATITKDGEISFTPTHSGMVSIPIELIDDRGLLVAHTELEVQVAP